ncbi:MAG TPA: hypothetical protein PKM88_13750 [bacterium]|nr:hypothetical protein [bacterium]
MEFTQIPQRNAARELSVADLRPNTIEVVYEEAGRSTPAIHSLGRVPQGFTVISATDAAGTGAIVVSATRDDQSKWTPTRIYTRADVPGKAKLEVR